MWNRELSKPYEVKNLIIIDITLLYKILYRQTKEKEKKDGKKIKCQAE